MSNDVVSLWNGGLKFGRSPAAGETIVGNGSGSFTLETAAPTPVADGDYGDITVSSSGAVWTIDNKAVTYAKMQDITATARVLGRITSGAGVTEELTGTQLTTLLDSFSSTLKGLAPPSGGGTANYLRADGTWAAPPGTGGVPDGDKGDITVSSSGTVWTIDNSVVTYAKMQNVSATARFLGRFSASAGVTEEITGTQATTLLDAFSSGLKGLAPASGGGTTNYLRADGSWAAPPGSVPDGDKGDITVSASGATWTIDNLVVTYAKMQNVSATSRVMGRVTAGAGSMEELTGAQVTGLLSTFTSIAAGIVPLSGGGTTNFLRADGSWAAPPAVTDGDKGDITVSAFGGLWTIDNQGVTYAKMQNVSATSRFLGRITAGAGSTEELTGTQATTLLDNVTSGLKGLAPASGGGTANFLRADATWALPVPDGDKGDVTTSASGATWTIDNQAVTYAKMQNVSATSRFLGRITAGAGSTEELTGTQATALLDAFTSVLKGLVPASGGGTSKFLRADGTFAAPPSDPWTYVKVAGSNFTTSSATAVDITGLAFTPSAGLSYEIEAMLYTRTATATTGPRPGVAWPTGLTDGIAYIQQTSAAGTVVMQNGNFNASVLAPIGGLPNTTQSWPALIQATFIAGGSPSGTFKLRLASETAGTNVTVQIGSWMRYRSI